MAVGVPLTLALPLALPLTLTLALTFAFTFPFTFPLAAIRLDRTAIRAAAPVLRRASHGGQRQAEPQTSHHQSPVRRADDEWTSHAASTPRARAIDPTEIQRHVGHHGPIEAKSDLEELWAPERYGVSGLTRSPP